MTRQPKLEDYQVRFVQNVARVLGGNFLRRCPAVRVLDMGCDCSGRQLAVISQLVRGEVVGINIPEGFPSPTAVATAGDRVRLLRMDGMQLDFPDASFDVVISANVIEHVPNVARFVAEAARVLKPGGICYMETAPVWTSARGHHLMESMVAENIPEEAGYRDDGSVIPEWGHLSMTREQMAEAIGDLALIVCLHRQVEHDHQPHEAIPAERAARHGQVIPMCRCGECLSQSRPSARRAPALERKARGPRGRDLGVHPARFAVVAVDRPQQADRTEVRAAEHDRAAAFG